MKRLIRVVGLTAGLGLAATGLAAPQGYYEPARHDAAIYDYARVESVDPIVEVVDVPVRRDECYQEDVVHRDPGHGTAAGTIVGGIIGGVVGNQFGKGSGKTAATAAGVAAGAVIGNNATRRPGEDYVTTEDRCRPATDLKREEHIIGYNVRYSYKGETYSTRMDRDPGERLRVRVSVTPVD